MEEKKTLKEWFIEKKAKISKFCEDHPDVVFTVIGGFASLAGGFLRYMQHEAIMMIIFTQQ